MKINKSIDIEYEIQKVLSEYMTAYCRPLPKDYDLPHVLIRQVSGTDSNTIDTFMVTIDSRAETDAEASDTLRTAVGILKSVAKEQTSSIRHIVLNSSGSWGNDPVRPDLSMCSATLMVTAHEEIMEV